MSWVAEYGTITLETDLVASKWIEPYFIMNVTVVLESGILRFYIGIVMY